MLFRLLKVQVWEVEDCLLRGGHGRHGRKNVVPGLSRARNPKP